MSTHLNSWGILKHFAAKKQFGFTFQDVINEFPGRKPENLATILTKMVSQGMLLRLSKGIYSIIPLHESPETYVPKGLEIVKHLMGKREYYLAYASALKIHGIFPVLPENKLQEETWEFVVTTCQIKPAKKDFHGSRFQFICRKKSRYPGFMELWINPYEKAISSDLERTIAEACARPQYCGGITEVAQAIFITKERVDQDKLFFFFAAEGNRSALMRFLFLSDLLGLEWTQMHERMMNERGSGITLLDPSGRKQGIIQCEFGLNINVHPDYIRSKIFNLTIREKPHVTEKNLILSTSPVIPLRSRAERQKISPKTSMRKDQFTGNYLIP